MGTKAMMFSSQTSLIMKTKIPKEFRHVPRICQGNAWMADRSASCGTLVRRLPASWLGLNVCVEYIDEVVRHICVRDFFNFLCVITFKCDVSP